MNWYVLFVQTLYEDMLCSLLNKDDRLFTFSAKLENYRRDRDAVEIKSLFPGYVFVKTKLDQVEFNTWLRKQEFKKGFIKQLQRESVSALTPEEVQLFNLLLDERGVLKMSYGTIEDTKLVIKEGPLVGFDDYIVKYDKRNRRATLDLFFLDKQWVAGVTLLENKEL